MAQFSFKNKNLSSAKKCIVCTDFFLKQSENQCQKWSREKLEIAKRLIISNSYYFEVKFLIQSIDFQEFLSGFGSGLRGHVEVKKHKAFFLALFSRPEV